MSTSLRSPKPTGIRRPVPGPDQQRASEPYLAAHERCALPDSSCPDGRVEQDALAERPERLSDWPTTPKPRLVAHDHQTLRVPSGPSKQAGQIVLTGERQRLSGVAPSRHKAQPGSRLGRRRGVAGLVAVCVLALGVAACSAKDAKAESSASASTSASAAIARAEKGIADANASATASREAALTPELRAKRDAALAEPAPAKPPQLNEDSAEGAAASVGYFLDLYRYAFMTGNTTEIESMSENGCVFCKSVIDRANQLHKDGGWANKWEQDITNIRYYDKLEGYDYSRIEATINYGEMISYSGGSWEENVAPPTEGQKVRFAIRYVNGGWAIREGEVLQ